jgi:hypothetical protein
LERSQVTAAACGKLNAAQRRAAACGQLGEDPPRKEEAAPAPTVDHAALAKGFVPVGRENGR